MKTKCIQLLQFLFLILRLYFVYFTCISKSGNILHSCYYVANVVITTANKGILTPWDMFCVTLGPYRTDIFTLFSISTETITHGSDGTIEQLHFRVVKGYMFPYHISIY